MRDLVLGAAVQAVMLYSAYGADLDLVPGPTSSSRLEGRPIDSIAIDNRNVFDTKERQHNNFLYRTANKIRWVTRPWVIRNELLFKVGDTFSTALADETARNLRLRVALYEAWVDADTLPNGHVALAVRSIDQWSLRGGARFNREANESNYHVGLEDLNFLGRNEFLSLYYFVQEKDDNFATVMFRDPRIFGRPLSVELDYSGHPVEGIQQTWLARPYYNLSQHLAFDLKVGKQRGRLDGYLRDNVRTNSSRYRSDAVSFVAGYRFGNYRQKVGPLISYNYLHKVIFDTTTLLSGFQAPFPTDSSFHQIGLGITLANLDFATTRRIAGFSYTEDVSLGQTLEVMYSRAYRHPFSGRAFDLVEWQLSEGFRVGQNIALCSFVGSRWTVAGLQVRRLTSAALRHYNTSLSFLTTAFRAGYVEDIRVSDQHGLIFGGRYELRGYDRFFRTGERLAVVNLEGRFFPGIELLTAQFGAVVFADAGTVWMRGYEPTWNNLYASVGVGLRIALDKVVKGDVIRIDVAHGRVSGWQVAIGTGQYF